MSEEYPPHWHRHRDNIRDALDRSGNTHSLENVLHALRTDDRAFWLATPDAFAFFEIHDYPLKRVVNWSLGGGELRELLSFEGRLCEFGRRLGCAEAQLYGRKGWLRVLPDDYRQTGVILRKSLL